MFKILDETEKDLWNRFVDTSPYGTILQYHQWGEVKSGEGWSPLIVGIFEGEQLVLGAQILRKQAPLLGTYFYIPYGPIFSSTDKLRQYFPQFLTELETMARKENAFAIEFEPLLGQLTDERKLPSFANLQPYTDTEVFKILEQNGLQRTKRNMQPKYKLMYDLASSEEELLAMMKKNTRYNVRYAQKNGVVIKKYLPDSLEISKELGNFYELLLEMQKRAHGYPVRPRSSFEKLLEVFKGTDDVQLFAASFENDEIMINISEFSAKWASSFYRGSNRLHPQVKAGYLLRWESVLEAKRRGCKVYDFWGFIPNSIDHAGYSNEKLSFGGIRIDTYGLLAYPLSGWRYFVWDKLLPLRSIFKK